MEIVKIGRSFAVPYGVVRGAAALDLTCHCPQCKEHADFTVHLHAVHHLRYVWHDDSDSGRGRDLAQITTIASTGEVICQQYEHASHLPIPVAGLWSGYSGAIVHEVTHGIADGPNWYVMYDEDDDGCTVVTAIVPTVKLTTIGYETHA